MEITSLNRDLPNNDAATPRTAEEIMCVIGDVTLMESRLARLIKNPITPCRVHSSSANAQKAGRVLTVMRDPQTNVCSSESSPGARTTSVDPEKRLTIAGTSPARTITGIKSTALKRFVYQERFMALPLTTSRLFLITTECTAVIAELDTPNAMPTRAIGVESRKMPTKKPSVTTEHAIRIRKEGRACKKM